MALVVEDGSGLELANAYWALVDVNTYHADRGNTIWLISQTLRGTPR